MTTNLILPCSNPEPPPATAGFWGADCSLSLGPQGDLAVLHGRGYQPRERRPRVYVYDLPAPLASW